MYYDEYPNCLTLGATQQPQSYKLKIRTLQNPKTMLVIPLLIVLFGFNLYYILSQAGNNFYKDSRFWLTMVSIMVMVSVVVGV